MLRVDELLDLGQALSATLFPALVGVPAEVAGARGYAVRVEAGVLVEGDHVRGVRGAEDVAAVTAVVTAQEEAKGGATGGGVAVGGGRVRLVKLAWCLSDKSCDRARWLTFQ